MISLQKLLNKIFSVTQGVCTNQIPLQYIIHHLSAQAVSNTLRSTQQLLKKVQFVFTGDNNTYKMMTSNETRLKVAITDIIIYEDLYFNLSQNLGSRRCLIWKEMCQNVINLPTETLYLRIFWT